MIVAAINTHALAEMAYSSVLAGVGVAVVFSLAILGVARTGEMRREHRIAPGLPIGGRDGCHHHVFSRRPIDAPSF